MARTLGYEVSVETVDRINEINDKYGHKRRTIVEMAIYVLSQLDDAQMGTVAAATRANRALKVEISQQPQAEAPVVEKSAADQERRLRAETQKGRTQTPARKRNTG